MFKYSLVITAAFLGSTPALADHYQYDMRVDGLTCPFCVATSSKALKRIDGVYDVAADLDTGIISVCAKGDTELGDEKMKRLFRRKGFTYRSQTISEGCTITEITHSETDSNLSEHTHKTPLKTDDNHDHNDEKHDHSDHDHDKGYGS